MEVSSLIGEAQKSPACLDPKDEEHKDRQPKLCLEVEENVKTDGTLSSSKAGNKCSLPHCCRSKRANPGMKIFRFPSSDTPLFKEWAERCNFDEKFLARSPLLYLCDKHFSPDCIGKKYLKRGVVPTLYLSDFQKEFENDDIDSSILRSPPSKKNCIVVNNSDDVKDSEHDIKLELGSDAKSDDESIDDMMFEEFQYIEKPQPSQIPPKQQNIPSSSSLTTISKSSNPEEDQMQFVKDLSREEDITRSNKYVHIGDSDYNFLISLLPQMKKMSDLQNLQFRSRMCDMIANIFATSDTATVSGNKGNNSGQVQL